jgi:hypothetical protein
MLNAGEWPDGLETVTGMAMDVLADTPSPKKEI